MAPPKKKRKLVVVPTMDIAEGPSSSSSSSDDKISRKDRLVKELTEQLGVLESSEGCFSSAAGDAATSMGLLKLKSLQRGILERIRETKKLLEQQANQRDQQESELENLRYQERIHEHSKTESDRAVESTSLEIARLVRKSSQTSEETPPELLLNKFLGEDWKDPSNREAIVARLNDEVARRKKLRDELNQLRDDQKSKEESLAFRQKLLKDLPYKLADMEKASLPLQKFCQKQNASSPSLMKTASKLGTTKRRSRLDLAKTLPKALYTLFHQLQSCLDVMGTNHRGSSSSLEAAFGIPADALPTVEIQNDSSSESTAAAAAVVVLLKIPIPTLSSGGATTYRPKKLASVFFRYDEGLDIVLAACGEDYDMGQAVIDELFPGDTGEFSWKTTTTTTTDAAGSAGKAYQWCNYLAGLHVSPVEQTAAKMHSSARVVLRTLVRRVRATATLSWILHSLSRKPNASGFPVHPALKENDDTNNNPALKTTKLSSWTMVSKKPPPESSSNHRTNNNIRSYKAVLQHGSGQGLERLFVRVSFDLARYPSSIPKWKILSSSSPEADGEEDSLGILLQASGGEGEAPPQEQLPLYNEALARLEQEVNQKVDQLVVSSDQTTYDWILAQQLTKIAEGWVDSL